MQSLLGRLLLAKVNLAYNRIPWVLLDIRKQPEFETAVALTLVVALLGAVQERMLSSLTARVSLESSRLNPAEPIYAFAPTLGAFLVPGRLRIQEREQYKCSGHELVTGPLSLQWSQTKNGMVG